MRRLAALSCCLLLAGSLARAETMEEVEKKISEAYGKLKSYSCKMKSTIQSDMGEAKYKQDSSGTQEFLRKDGKTYFRMEGRDSTTSTMSGKEERSEGNTLVIMDPEYTYTYREELAGERKGTKSAMKTKSSPDMDMLKAMREHFNLKLLPDEKVDGADCWVIEATMKKVEGMPETDQRSVMYYRKDLGVVVKSVGFQGGKEMSKSETSDVKVNVDLPADRFVFKAPAGVEVVDMSKMGEPEGQPPEQPKEEPKEDKPKEQPKEEKPKEDGPKIPKPPRLP